MQVKIKVKRQIRLAVYAPSVYYELRHVLRQLWNKREFLR